MLARLVSAAVLAAVGFVPAAASAGPAAPVATANTICVGLILDRHSIGGPVDGDCVNVKPGTTGVGVLEAAGHAVTFRQDGLLCTIDGVPETGCSKVDNTHYWAYYHRAPDRTTWSYSVQDSRTYEPANRSTEGWVYDNGSKLEPQNIPAAQLCDELLKPTRSPTPSLSHHAPKPRHSATPTAVASSVPSVAASEKPAETEKARHPRERSATPTPPDAIEPSDPATTPSTTAFASDTRDAGGNGSATGAVITAAVIGVLAAATVVAARRRRR